MTARNSASEELVVSWPQSDDAEAPAINVRRIPILVLDLVIFLPSG
jgi:hypothetical protein